MGISVLNDKCIGCKLCVPACPFGAISVTDRKAIIGEACNLCGACVPVCKFSAIDLQREESPMVDKSAYTGVWVYAEQRHGRLADQLGPGCDRFQLVRAQGGVPRGRPRARRPRTGVDR